MSIRDLTQEQFSEGTTIDGNRLSKAMDAVRRRLERLPNGDLSNRWLQTQYVVGWTPAQYPAADRRIPFVHGDNTGFIPGGGTPTNPHRFKGVPKAGLYATLGFTAKRPTIIQDITAIFMEDLPSGLVGTYDETSLLVTIDNPFDAENQRQNSVLLNKRGSDMRVGHAPAPAMDMTPNWAVSPGLTGQMLRSEDINIPVPPGGRVRATLGRDTFPLALGSFQDFIPTLVFSVLEGLVDGR